MQIELVLGVDQGTGSTKAVVLDATGEEIVRFSAVVAQPSIEGRRVTQDVSSIRDSVQEVISEAFKWSEQQNRRFRAIGLACQRSGVTAWRADTGESVHPLVTWADTSTSRAIEELGTRALKVSDATGIPTIPNFAAGKIAELQKKFPWPGERIATLDAYLTQSFTEGHHFFTEDTMAARTMLYDLRAGKWSEELCRLFSVDIRRLPEIRPTVDDFGLIDGVPLKVLIGDQQAALLGRTTSNEMPLLNLGTIASLTIPTSESPVIKPGLMSSVWFSKRTVNAKPGHDRSYTYLTEVTSPITGFLLKELIEVKRFAVDLAELSDRCNASWSKGLKIVQYSTYGSAYEPTWPKGVPDVLIAPNDADNNDIARAAVENVGHTIVKLIDQFEEYKLCFQNGSRHIMVSGGGSDCLYLLQYIADCVDATLIIAPSREATARGAALATLIRDAHGKDVQMMNSLDGARKITPQDLTRRQKYLKWRRLEQDVLAGRVPPQARVEYRQ